MGNLKGVFKLLYEKLTMRNMPKIFIDTQYFLDLYRSTKKIEPILEDIGKVAPYLIIPEQVKDEFIRNRDGVIREIKSSIERIKDENIGHFGLFLGDPDVLECMDISKKHSEIRKKMITKCDEILNRPKDDKIFNYFLKLYKDPRVVIIKRNNKIITNAIKRKNLGNPPVSDGKITVGDEVIWESLLTIPPDDLIIISKDSTYTDHFTFLSREYKEKKHKKLTVSKEISKVLSDIRQEPSNELRAFEQEREIQDQKEIKSVARGGLLAEVMHNMFLDALNNQSSDWEELVGLHNVQLTTPSQGFWGLLPVPKTSDETDGESEKKPEDE